jgi:signal transduction histidine kinase
MGCAPITVAPMDPALVVCADRDELTRVLSNLIENALRHTPADGSIELSAERRDGAIGLKVADTGCGIPAEHLPHLCERFYRADPSRARAEGGTGLGLAICKSLVEANGGRMQIFSEVGKGTTALVILPAG